MLVTLGQFSAQFAAASALAVLLALDPLAAVADWAVWLVDEAFGGVLHEVGYRWLGLAPLRFEFFQRSVLAAAFAAVLGPLVGTFLVNRELAMVGDTLAHTAFAGVAAGLFVNATLPVTVSPTATALVVACVTALVLETLLDRADVNADVALALLLTGGFALGSVLVTLTDGGISVGIDAHLFGSLATVSTDDVLLLAGMCVLVGGAVAAAYRPLTYVAFDPVGARAARVPVARYERLLTVLTAVVVVGAMRVMGVILVAALLVVPVATASHAARTSRGSLFAGVAFAEVAALLGVFAAYRFGTAAGGSIVLVAIAVFVAVLAAGRVRATWLGRARRRGAGDAVGAGEDRVAADAEGIDRDD
ncbi:metal ABC transporter permease [Halorarum salinum]|uniref:Metal ABC transporter permease n=1 Tax=Halorarum salinum TaxID=2743089 RepID=A0A7D5LDY4_9EURY|nr:metal ABC transporter permease [Halobaculum salinum]QLG64254.1 metal ABC transporter permease [Halobaculum salinum]